MSPPLSNAVAVTCVLLFARTSTAFVTSGRSPLPYGAFGGALGSRRTLPHPEGRKQHRRHQPCGDSSTIINNNGQHQQSRRTPRMHASDVSVEDSYATLAGLEMEEKQSLGFALTTKAIDVLFKIDPLFENMKNKARDKIIKRSYLLGVGWSESVDGMRRNMDELETEYGRVLDQKVSTPSYYYAPFHCYPEGNLCWQAALEVEPSAICVHANLYTEDNKIFERDGDDKLRSNYHQRMQEMLKGPEPKDILDIGCSTGLSTLKLAQTFPSARITGVDLSPHMLAVGRYFLRTREEQRGARGRVEYLHAAGEVTGMGEASMDLVSLCLTSHELPEGATRDIFREAYRVLRPGGAISFMDMNPRSPSFQNLARNPFSLAGFKSSEPYLQDYISLDLGQELLAAGFRNPEVRSNSARHRTCVAYVDK
ncbi:unnamed protein product [Pylaiella littoralis]